MKKFMILIILIAVFISVQLYGIIWSPLIRLTWNSGVSQGPSIAADSGNGIHVVWYDNPTGKGEIYYKRSTNGGTTWSGSKRLTWNMSWSYNPSIAVDSGNRIHVAWFDDLSGKWEIFYKCSTDSGTTWSGPTRLTWNTGLSYYPSIAADSGSSIHMVWQDNTPGNNEIFYKRSTNSGTSWSGPTRMTWTPNWSITPSIAADSGTGIHIVWREDAPGNGEIFYKRSTDGGTTWSSPKRLSWNTGISWYPSIALDSSNGIYITWQDETPGNEEIFYKRSTDGGATWSMLKRLTWNAGSSEKPSIAADPGTGVHVLWYDDTTGNSEIFYKRSSDSGVSWWGPIRLTWNAGDSKDPSISADLGSRIHAVWQDNPTGKTEIYYKNLK